MLSFDKERMPGFFFTFSGSKEIPSRALYDATYLFLFLSSSVLHHWGIVDFDNDVSLFYRFINLEHAPGP